MSADRLYIWPTHWDRFQLRKNHGAYPWFKLYSDLTSKDEWNELSTADRCLLIGIWSDTNRLGLGRVSANLAALRSRHSCRRASLDSLVQAGFIEISSTQGARPEHSQSTPEEKRVEEEPLKALPSTNAGKDRLASPQSGSPIPTNQNGQPRKPSPTELDDGLRPLSQADLHAPMRDAQGFLY